MKLLDWLLLLLVAGWGFLALRRLYRNRACGGCSRCGHTGSKIELATPETPKRAVRIQMTDTGNTINTMKCNE